MFGRSRNACSRNARVRGTRVRGTRVRATERCFFVVLVHLLDRFHAFWPHVGRPLNLMVVGFPRVPFFVGSYIPLPPVQAGVESVSIHQAFVVCQLWGGTKVAHRGGSIRHLFYGFQIG